MTRLLLAPALALALVAGCGGAAPYVSLEPPQRAPKASEYVDVLKRWTRHAQLLDDFDQALTVNATLRSPEFRAAYAAKWIALFRIGPDDAAATRDKLLSDGGDNWELYVETSMHRYELNEFASPKTVWRVALVDDKGHEETTRDIHPSTVRPELDAEFYPYLTIFSRGWRIRFPKLRSDGTPMVGPDTRSLTLRISGPPGSVDLTWTIK